MYGIPSTLVYDVATATRQEHLNQAGRQQLIREAANGRQGHLSIFGSIRRAIGKSLIAAGRSVSGDRIESIDLTEVPSVGTLRLAR